MHSSVHPREVGVPHGPRVAWDGVRILNTNLIIITLDIFINSRICQQMYKIILGGKVAFGSVQNMGGGNEALQKYQKLPGLYTEFPTQFWSIAQVTYRPP